MFGCIYIRHDRDRLKMKYINELYISDIYYIIKTMTSTELTTREFSTISDHYFKNHF